MASPLSLAGLSADFSSSQIHLADQGSVSDRSVNGLLSDGYALFESPEYII
ncbi:hypothetical protein MUG84_26425 [Paenibacillus sp. KQZ6P-2]|uniref:Uncharacterized protein n=1 Tax=Paenibacillus mangrovi TaxID=2931978 RepID=A0A9X1WX84_9BACL|nr:hypothetical protein [Paenibacillus mangrovi]MCJ8015208.1 hypothetical protein [Paenibacillus mangrovi]